MRRWIEAAALAALVAVGIRHGLVPPPLPRGPATPFDFSAARAMGSVRRLAAAPRPPGSPAHGRAREWALTRLVSLGADTMTQVVVQPSPRVPKAALVRNAAARLPGREGGPAVLLVAHYDGHAATPAAGDDATGVAIVLEVMRALRAGPPLRHDVIALLTDAEEEGMLGARAFVASHPWRGEVGVVINVEARGAGGRSLMFETGTPNRATIAAYAAEVRAPTASSLFYALYRLLPNDTDFTELRALGAPGLNFAFIGRVASYHTPLDTAEGVDRRTLHSQGEAVLRLARRFALEGPPADTAGGGSAVFFSAPGVGLAWWPLEYNWAFTAVGVLLLAAAIGFGLHRRRLRVGGVALGVAGTLVATGLAVAAAIGLRIGLGALLVRQSSAGVRELHPALALAPLVLALGTALALLRLGRRWATPDALASGSAILWAAGAVALAFRLPEGSYLLLVPAAGAAVALLVRVLLSDETGPPWARWVATAALLPVLVPLLPLLFLGLGTGPVPAGAAAALTALAVWLLAPMVAALDLRRWWAVPAVALLGAAGLGIWALRAAHHSADWPRPENVTVTVEADSLALGIERMPAERDEAGERLRIRPPAGTRRLELRLDRPPRSARMAGLELATGESPDETGWLHSFVAPPDTGLVVEVVPAPGITRFEVAARIPGLPPGTARPAATMPFGTGDETVAVRAMEIGERGMGNGDR